MGGWVGGREGVREGGREGGWVGGREGGSEGGREGGRKGGREAGILVLVSRGRALLASLWVCLTRCRSRAAPGRHEGSRTHGCPE